MAGAQSTIWTTQDVADSFALWWRDAGLHSLTSPLPHSWLEEAERPAPSHQPAAAAALPPRPAFAGSAARPHAMPADLAAFRAWLADEPTHPEAAWGGPAIFPPARTDARLIILCEMAEAGADDPTLPFAPATRRFLSAMLGAIGLTLDDAAVAPLAFRRQPGGLIDEPTMAFLAERMRHYLGLARPRAGLILGDRTSRALLAPQAPAAPGHLPMLHHGGGTMATAALPSMDHLMRRPSAKAASWQQLRLLGGSLAA